MFRHFLFTRWNRLDRHMTIYNNPQIKDPEVWMDHRMNLFDEITLMSVMLQTETNFTWLLSFAEETPQAIIDKYASFPRVKIIYEYPPDWLGRNVKDGEWIITSRLDNDDYISPTYIEKVQAKFNREFLLVDTDGRQRELATGKLYTVERRTCNSPFISLIEHVGTEWTSVTEDKQERRLITDRLKTVYWCSHSKMEWHFPAVKIPEVLYHMVIHDRNAANRIIGYEVGRI